MVPTETDKMLNKLIKNEISPAQYLRFQGERDLAEINAKCEAAVIDTVAKAAVSTEIAQALYWQQHEGEYIRYQEASRKLFM